MRQSDTHSRRHIYLTGFSGSGKSVVGQKLGVLLHRPFIDTDKLIEEHFRKSIPLIFERHGEGAFRGEEALVIGKIASRKRPAVVALGGGAFEVSANRNAIRCSGVTIYLRCSTRELYRRLRHVVDRPMLRGRSRLERMQMLLARRKPNYEAAEITVSTTTQSPRAVAIRIVKVLMRKDYENQR